MHAFESYTLFSEMQFNCRHALVPTECALTHFPSQNSSHLSSRTMLSSIHKARLCLYRNEQKITFGPNLVAVTKQRVSQYLRLSDYGKVSSTYVHDRSSHRTNTFITKVFISDIVTVGYSVG